MFIRNQPVLSKHFLADSDCPRYHDTSVQYAVPSDIISPTGTTTAHSAGYPYEPESISSFPCIQDSLPAADAQAIDIVRQFRLKHPKNFIISHYNVNSIRHKLCELLPLLTECKVDILAIAESKLDDSFPSEQFKHVISNFIDGIEIAAVVESWSMLKTAFPIGS